MSITIKTLVGIIIISFTLFSCTDESPTESAPAIYFTVDGFSITVHNLWKSGGSHTVNTEGLIAFNETVSREGESHTLEWSGIVKENFTVVKFYVIIDGREYVYPAVSRGTLPSDIIRFSFNGTAYEFREAYSPSSKPYGGFSPEDTSLNRVATYFVSGAATVQNHKDKVNSFQLSVSYNRWFEYWQMTIYYYNAAGTKYTFRANEINILEIHDRNTVGVQMWGRFPGPYGSDTDTLRSIEFSVERL